MKVFKFGGASVKDAHGVRNVSNILKIYSGEKILIIISAMGKTTNALETVVKAYTDGQIEQALRLFNEIKNHHNEMAKELLSDYFDNCHSYLNDFYTEAEWLLHDKPVKSYDYYYDQLVCIGELLSTTIVSHYLNAHELSNLWIDVRDVLRTDNNFREANVDWAFTEGKVREIIAPLFEKSNLILTQGFIGATDENESTTLGREGSDYSAAIFANMLNAESQTIWKDVESVMSADPREIKDAQPISELNYTEVIEMAYYGAQVIHPKTIKPIQNKSIPLHVKCFLNAALPGTMIHNQPVYNLPPIVVIKRNQVMIEFKSKDFSFVGEKLTGSLYHLFEKLSIRPNMTQNGAINMLCVFDNREEKISQLAHAAAEMFDVQLSPELTLLTIRHYDDESVKEYTAGKDFIVKQQTSQNIRLLYKS